MAKGTVLGSIHKPMSKPLASVFAGDSWHAWRTLLRACFEGMEGLPDAERDLVHSLTGRMRLPATLVELGMVAGRRSGKSIIAALVAVWATCCRAPTRRWCPAKLACSYGCSCVEML